MVVECLLIIFVTSTSYLCVTGSSVGIATTGWTVRDRIPVGTRFSARTDRPGGLHPSSYKTSTGSSRG